MFASELGGKESKKVNMAYVVPVPYLARTEAEPLLATIGNTPLVRLERIPAEFPGVEICAKAEYFNPGGSVKDRAALNMMLDGERSGKLNHEPHDSRCHQRQHRHRLRHDRRQPRVPGEARAARQCLRRAQADSEGLRRGDGFQRCRARVPTAPSACAARSTKADPDRYFYPDQYNNPANWKAHFDATGAGDHRADRRAPHPLRGRHGHQRHVHRRHPPAASATCRK